MGEPLRRDVGGIAGCAIAIAVGALAWYYAKDFSTMGAVFPRTVSAAMILFATVYIAVALLRPSPRAAPARGSAWRRFALVAVMAAWSIFLEKVGFLSTSVACYAAILVIANYDRWTPRMAVVYALSGGAVLGGLYAIFKFVLLVPLPAGLLL
jgi:putative tricarboxylic transport membrane protein